MLSRVAENTFWMGRYMERTSTHLRNLKTYYGASQDNIPYAKWDEVYAGFNNGKLPTQKLTVIEMLHFILFDKENEASVLNNIFRARENARSAQDHISKELWQCLNDYYLLVKDENIQKQLINGDPVSVFDQLLNHCMLFYGVVDISMFRGEGYNYLNIGKYVERVLQCSIYFRHQLYRSNSVSQSSLTIVSWRYYLLSISGYEFYLKTSSGSIDPDKIFYQVFFKNDFPHSAVYCMQQLNRYTQKLRSDSKSESYKKVMYEVGKSTAHIIYSKTDLTIPEQLKFLTQIENDILKIVETYNKHYFGITN